METAMAMAVELEQAGGEVEVCAAATCSLASLRPGQVGQVAALRMPGSGHGHDRNTVLRLLEIGFVEGESVRVVALGPGGVEPMAVRVGRSLFALRRHEAEHVQVRLDRARP